MRAAVSGCAARANACAAGASGRQNVCAPTRTRTDDPAAPHAAPSHTQRSIFGNLSGCARCGVPRGPVAPARSRRVRPGQGSWRGTRRGDGASSICLERSLQNLLSDVTILTVCAPVPS